MTTLTTKIQEAAAALDEKVRRTMYFHFSDKTGCRYWLERRGELKFDPLKEIDGFNDVVEKFPVFDDTALKTKGISDWKPQGFKSGTMFSMYQTGGTTGSPSRRIGRTSLNAGESDFADDYVAYAEHLRKRGFQGNGLWAFLGPQGPRRLREGVKVLAREFGSDIVEIDMDAGWAKTKDNPDPAAYGRHVRDAAIATLNRDKPTEVFCSPQLLEKIGPLFDWSTSGVRAVFSGGGAMVPDTIRYFMNECFKGQVLFEPAFGNALVGLSFSRPFATKENPIDGQFPYQIYYHPRQPVTVVQVTEKDDHTSLVKYGEYGYVSTCAFTKEWFMPNKREERDYGMRVEPTDEFPWDGFSNIHIPAELAAKLSNVGVY